MKSRKSQLIVALDVDTFQEARRLINILSPAVDIFKVGSHLFTACGPVVVRLILAQGRKVFLDLKYHDIPNTVANAVKVAVGLGVSVHEAFQDTPKAKKERPAIFMYTLHIQGGQAMLEAALRAGREESKKLGVPRPLALGITVLTSEEKEDSIATLIKERVRLAKKAGLDGVVASAQEVRLIREAVGKDFIIVTPGIRPHGAQAHDQERVATPAEAIRSGSDYLVVGRPIVKSKAPLKAAQAILAEIKQAQSWR